MVDAMICSSCKSGGSGALSVKFPVEITLWKVSRQVIIVVSHPTWGYNMQISHVLLIYLYMAICKWGNPQSEDIICKWANSRSAVIICKLATCCSLPICKISQLPICGYNMQISHVLFMPNEYSPVICRLYFDVSLPACEANCYT